MHGFDSLTRELRRIGVSPGGVLLVQGSLRAVGPIEGGARTLVAALREVLGPRGTLVAYTATPENSLTSRLDQERTAGMDEEQLRDYRGRMPAFDPRTTPVSPTIEQARGGDQGDTGRAAQRAPADLLRGDRAAGARHHRRPRAAQPPRRGVADPPPVRPSGARPADRHPALPLHGLPPGRLPGPPAPLPPLPGRGAGRRRAADLAGLRGAGHRRPALPAVRTGAQSDAGGAARPARRPASGRPTAILSRFPMRWMRSPSGSLTTGVEHQGRKSVVMRYSAEESTVPTLRFPLRGGASRRDSRVGGDGAWQHPWGRGAHRTSRTSF